MDEGGQRGVQRAGLLVDVDRYGCRRVSDWRRIWCSHGDVEELDGARVGTWNENHTEVAKLMLRRRADFANLHDVQYCPKAEEVGEEPETLELGRHPSRSLLMLVLRQGGVGFLRFAIFCLKKQFLHESMVYMNKV